VCKNWMYMHVFMHTNIHEGVCRSVLFSFAYTQHPHTRIRHVSPTIASLSRTAFSLSSSTETEIL